MATNCETAPQTISNASGGVKLFWKREVLDTGGFLSSDCTLKSELVAPRTGVYMITASIEWPSAPDSGTRTLGLKRANGPYIVADRRENTPNQPTQQSISTLYKLNQFDRIQVWAYQTSGSALPIDGTLQTTNVTIHWVGP